jgi:hypothetical protein
MAMNETNLNAVYSRPNTRRRYEAWFVRMGLADGSGAWWFRYLLLNPGRAGCASSPRGMPAQVWATWFPRNGAPQSFIQRFPARDLHLSAPGASPFRFAIGKNRIDEDSCAGNLNADGHEITWDLCYRSRLAVTISDRGWIGFSSTQHSGAVFSGEISLDGRTFRGDTLGYGLQGHNCGYRHRHEWTWTHCVFKAAAEDDLSTFEALEYEMPLGLRFRKAILWLGGEIYTFRKFTNERRDRENLRWVFDCTNPREGLSLQVSLDGSGASHHRLPYLKTDCSGTFDVSNNSLARATLRFERKGHSERELVTDGGAVLEMTGG